MGVDPELFEFQTGGQDDFFKVGVAIQKQPSQGFVQTLIERALDLVLLKFQPLKFRAGRQNNMAHSGTVKIDVIHMAVVGEIDRVAGIAVVDGDADERRTSA